MTSRSLGCYLLTALLLAGSGAADAAEGRIPIPFETPVTFPITISNGGSYVLTRNLDTTGIVLLITAADPVVIDLNGMDLKGLDGSGDVVSITGNSVRIHNGQVIGGRVGISSVGQSLVVERVSVINSASDGIAFKAGTVRNSRITGAGQNGILVDGSGVKGYINIESNFVDQVDVAGISLLTNATSGSVSGARITNNAVTQWALAGVPGSAGQGIALVGFRNARVENNVVTDCGSTTPADAIVLLNCENVTVENNQISGPNTSVGVDILNASGVRVIGNQIKSMVSYGMWLRPAATGILFDKNSVSNCADWGLLVDAGADGTAVRGNLLNNNGGATCPSPRGTNFCNAGSNTLTFGDNFANDVPTLW